MEIIILALALAVIGFIMREFCDVEDTPEDKNNNENHKSTRITVIVKWLGRGLGRAFMLSAVILILYVGCEYGLLSCDNVIKYTYDDSSITTVSKYFAKDDSIYAELKNDDIYELETSLLTDQSHQQTLADFLTDNTDTVNEKAIIKINNEYFSNCFVPKGTVISYYKTNWLYISKSTKNSVLYVDKDTYAELMDITPLDIP